MEPNQAVESALSKCRAGFARDPNPALATRKEHIRALADVTIRHRHQIRDALRTDYRRHPDTLSDIVECSAVVARCEQAIANLDAWAAPEPRELDAATFGEARAWMAWQPKGVVGNMVPWNFPFELGLSPVAEMLGAGNRVVIKPSEMAPACADLLSEMIAAAFDPDQVTTVLGGADVAEAFAAAPWDHLMYTGSTEVGRRVMALAAPNLTPLTLELGGKCPIVIGSNGLQPRTMQSIVGLKLAKSGQICVTVDYLLVPRGEVARLKSMLLEYCAQTLKGFSTGDSATGIISERHFARLRAIVDDAAQRGAEVVMLEPGAQDDPESRVMPLRLLIDPPPGSRAREEEVFGPLLPVIPYDSFDEAIAHINAGGSPLGVNIFSDDQQEIDALIARTRSGGVTVNGASLHSASPNLGFGGIGESGFGRHHGVEGFQEFSNRRAIFVRGPEDATDIIFPPYGPDKAAIAQMAFELPA